MTHNDFTGTPLFYAQNAERERQQWLDDHQQRVRNRIKETEDAYHRRQEELDNKVAPFRSAVFNLGLEPSDNEVQDFINFLSNVKMCTHKIVFDTLRAGWEIIYSSEKVGAELKKKARLALLRVGVYLK